MNPNKIFIFASCRDQLPFNCNKKHNDIILKKYNLSKCLKFDKYFIGFLYCSNYIKMIIEILLKVDVNKKKFICVSDPQLNIDDFQFYQLCYKFYKAKIIIVEIATIKFFRIKNSEQYISHNHLKNFKPDEYDTCIISENELIDNIINIQQMLNSNNKEVLFVSHFNHANFSNRKIIINCLKKYAKYFFDPTDIVLTDIKKNLIDDNHYSFECEKIILYNLDIYLTKIINESKLLNKNII
jgi:hypothetical protein